MKTRTKGRLATAAVAAGLLLAGSAALAAGQGFRGGREGAPGRGLHAALSSLDLTSEQKVLVQELLDAGKPKMEALRQEGRAAREALRTAAEAAKPDPSAVGSAFLRVRAHREAVRAEREAARQKLESLLTAEQKAKLDGWREAHRQMRRGPGARGDRPFGRSAPPPPAG